MSDFAPTASQKQAIETRGGAILVSAGAGSGKTKVLTERLMKVILDPDQKQGIDRFVVITFTKASAAELRSRIEGELDQAAAEAEKNEDTPQEFINHIRHQQALCRNAQIGTIHHFCSSVLKEFGHQIGIPAGFKVATDDRADSMKEEALNRIMEARYRNMHEVPGFEDLVNSAGAGRDDSRLTALVLSLYEKMQCHALPKKWAENCVSALKAGCDDVGETPWGREILKTALAGTVYWSGEMDRLLSTVQTDETVFRAYGDALAQGAEGIRELERCIRRGWDAARQCPPINFGKFGRVGKDHAPELTEMVKKRRDDCKKAMANVSSLFYAGSEELAEEMKKTAPSMEALLQLTLDFEKEYADEKRRKGFLDYSDLEHLTAKLLIGENGAPTDLASALSRRYEEIMIDEYQDVSRVQEAIFQAVSDNGRKLFMVGDVKQAIYRFRLADPEIFNEKYRTYRMKSVVPCGLPGKILLRENFRSRKEILDAANSVFSSCMSDQLGDVAYDEAAALVYGAKGYANAVPLPEVRLIRVPEKDDNGLSPEKSAVEAAYVAERILQLIESETPVTTSEGTRSIQFGDIAVLLRNANTIGSTYRKAFLDKGIPVVSGRGEGFFSSREISFVMCLLRVMDDPYNEVALIAVLSSPFIGFSGDELTSIRAEDRDARFYDALRKHAEASEKAACFLSLLDALRDAAPDLTMEKLLRRILTETDVLPVCSAMSDGKRRYANLMQLIGMASDFESEGFHGLHSFVHYLEKKKNKNTVPASAEGSDSAVQIMSIHHSKGLEFPVVFLCDLSRRFNMRDVSETVLVHSELGLGPKIVDQARLAQYPTLARKAIAQRIKRETLSEEMRLLYVAMTRAKERLIMTAAMDDPEKFLEKQKLSMPSDGDTLEPEMLAAASTPIEWLTTAAIKDCGQTITLVCDHTEKAAFSREEATEQPESDVSSTLIEEITKKLSFVYPHTLEQDLPSKVTATELKQFEQREDREVVGLVEEREENRERKHRYFRMPDFALEKKPATGAEKGIATHLALQYMDLSKANTPEGVRSEIARLTEERYLSERQGKAVNQNSIVRLFCSELGERIRNADAVHREFRFSMLCKGSEILQTESEEEILLQGVVDCCLEENGQLVIIDYKTDSVFTEEQLAQRTAHYASQVKAYSVALTRILGKPVKETILYFLSCDRSSVVKQI